MFSCFTTFRRTILCVAALSLLWCLAPLERPALAHSVFIFAWVDGPQICTESYFTRKSQVRGGEVSMSSASGQVLAKGLSNDEGLICFPLPKEAQELSFTVMAGSGHKADFTLPASTFAGTVDTHSAKNGSLLPEAAASAPPAETAALVHATTGGNNTADAKAAAEASPIDPAALETGLQDLAKIETLLRAIVSEELQKQLSPIRRSLAEQNKDETPRLRDIIGGIGWLLGLGALAQWLRQRGKKE